MVEIHNGERCHLHCLGPGNGSINVLDTACILKSLISDLEAPVL